MNIQQTPEQQPTQPMPKPLSKPENSAIGSAWSWVGKVSGLLTACLPSSCAFKVPEQTEVVNLNSDKLPKIESNCEIEEMIVHAIHEAKEDSINQENNEINRESNQELGAISDEEMNRLIKEHTSEYGIPQRFFEHEDLYRVGQDDLTHARGDFKTAQGLEAAKKTFVTAGALTAFVARTKEPVIDTLLAEALSPREQFLKIMDAIDVCLDEADLNDPKECKFLNDLAGLLHKGFNPNIGGVGCLHNNRDWNIFWNELGNGKSDVSSFSKDNPHNENIKQSFRKMLAYYQSNAAAHFSPERHEGGRILAALQTTGTIGQLLNDFAFNQSYPKVIRNALEKKMVDNELVHSSLTSVDEFGKRVEETKNIMRSNPLLAEVRNDKIAEDILKQLNLDKFSEKLISIIANQLNTIDPENKLTPEEKRKISELIFNNLIETIKHIHLQTSISGNRGRLPFLPHLGQVGKELAGTTGKSNSIAVVPHRSHDELSDKWIKKSLGEDDPDIREFYKAVEKDNILKHGFSPTVPLRLGKGIDTHFARALEPRYYFLQAIQATIANKPEAKELLEQFASSIEQEDFKSEYREFMGKIEVTFNQATEQKVTLEEFASMSSVASIMYNNDLRTICSISGTTVDMALATTLTIGEEKAKQLLKPLLDHLEGKDPDPLNTSEGKKFKEFASSIAFFMQAGQYHTAGEVIGGLFIAARSLCSSEEKRTDINETYAMFEKLMKEFSDDPTMFFAITPEDKATIHKSVPYFSEAYKKQELERIHSKQQSVLDKP